ncbi:ISNCY family transposase [Frigidibacter sp. MR17.24]|uniref:ISNCY family transposase n=1 Tax=Frigidibacter sp. MR17.24 TaxID=3127345 RepID=UPI003012D536
MGWIVMSERELRRIEILVEVEHGRLSVDAGAGILAVSRRQMFRLLQRYRRLGACAVRHQSRGRAASNRIHDARRDYALTLVRESYADFGPTLAAEKLAEDHGLTVSRETLRKWMIAAGLWVSRKHRHCLHQPRLRRACIGELIQIDGSEHRWFEDRAAPCTLLVFIDDATSRLMHLEFVPSESTFSYFGALERYLATHGRPVAFYSDKHTVFRVPKPNMHSNGMTQFGRALAELNIEILCANSSQAKGRVERANRTLQDRLVKELRLAGISDMDAANAFLHGFIARHNARFAQVPAQTTNLHRPLNLAPDALREVLCLRDQRLLAKTLTITYDRKKLLLEDNDLARAAAGTYVDLYEFADGRLQVRHKGMALPFRLFDPHQQRVTHAAITENKRLAEVLTYIKTEQEKAVRDVRVPPSSAKNGYKKTGRTSLDRTPPRRRKLTGTSAAAAGQTCD